MAQFSNDCKGVSYVSNDAGQIVFNRPQVTATGKLATGTTAMPGWQLTDGVVDLASGANTINTTTGAIATGSVFF